MKGIQDKPLLDGDERISAKLIRFGILLGMSILLVNTGRHSGLQCFCSGVQISCQYFVCTTQKVGEMN